LRGDKEIVDVSKRSTYSFLNQNKYDDIKNMKYDFWNKNPTNKNLCKCSEIIIFVHNASNLPEIIGGTNAYLSINWNIDSKYYGTENTKVISNSTFPIFNDEYVIKIPELLLNKYSDRNCDTKTNITEKYDIDEDFLQNLSLCVTAYSLDNNAVMNLNNSNNNNTAIISPYDGKSLGYGEIKINTIEYLTNIRHTSVTINLLSLCLLKQPTGFVNISLHFR
jgi:hypothetical protein